MRKNEKLFDAVSDLYSQYGTEQVFEHLAIYHDEIKSDPPCVACTELDRAVAEVLRAAARIYHAHHHPHNE
jgi:cytidine deaminase